MNDAGTCEKIDTPLTQAGSGFDLSPGLTKLYRKVGPLTPAGHRISNILEQIQQPNPHVRILAKQMSELQRLLGS